MLKKSKSVKYKNYIPDIYDIFVFGSDKIWNQKESGENDPIYYLDFGTTTCKFSYAASSGSVRFGDENPELFKKYLQNLKSIGVRERFMQEYIKEELGLVSEINPDPTFLLNASEWSEIEKPYKGLPDNYLLIYTIKRPKETINFAHQVAVSLNLPTVQICNDRDLNALMHKDVDYRLMNVSPQQFLWLFHHASFIVTNTFHGNMFSVIYRKNFVHYGINSSDTRISTLHDEIRLKNKIVSSFEIDQRIIDYNLIEENVAYYCKCGLNFIQANINDD